MSLKSHLQQMRKSAWRRAATHSPMSECICLTIKQLLALTEHCSSLNKVFYPPSEYTGAVGFCTFCNALGSTSVVWKSSSISVQMYKETIWLFFLIKYRDINTYFKDNHFLCLFCFFFSEHSETPAVITQLGNKVATQTIWQRKYHFHYSQLQMIFKLFGTHTTSFVWKANTTLLILLQDK